MKRKKQGEQRRSADAILVADLHLTESTPVSRTDDYIQAQANKLTFLRSLSAENNNCPILCAGDLFDHWKASPWLCSWAFNYLPTPMITIPGNHDLPMHSIEYYDKSALALLETVSTETDFRVLRHPQGVKINDLYIVGTPFNKLEQFDPDKDKKARESITTFKGANRRVLLLHELVWERQRPLWAGNTHLGQELLDRFGGYFDLIVSGDNHESFVCQDNTTKSILVNPGSMMRSTADQEDFKPKCYLYYARTNKVTPVEFPIERGVLNTEHLDKKKERDDRITAYIERMSKDWEIGLSFRKNLQAFFAENNVPQKVREVVWQHLEAEKM